MSQLAVSITINKLLTDEDFRDRFVSYPLDTLALLHLEGVDLTIDEIGAFVRADWRTWSGSSELHHRSRPH